MAKLFIVFPCIGIGAVCIYKTKIPGVLKKGEA